MALPFDQITATAYKKYRPSLADNVMVNTALLAYMSENKRVERKTGGIKLVEPLLYEDNGTFKTYNGMEPLDVTPQNGITAAEYDWKRGAISITVSDEEIDLNSGKEQIINLMDGKVSQAEITIKKRMGAMLMANGTGNGGKDFAGIESYVNSTPAVGTVGNIDAATYSWWRNLFDTIPVFATTGLEQMRTMFNKLIRGAESPELVLLDRETHEAYEAILVPMERIAYTGSGQLKGDAGFDPNGLTFKGKPIRWDYYVTAKSIYFLNFMYIKFIIDSNKEWTKTAWRVPVNQLGKTCFLVCRGNLVCSNRAMQGKVAVTAYK